MTIHANRPVGAKAAGRASGWTLALAAVLALGPTFAHGSPPLDPLPVPLYSFDRDSPSVGPDSEVRADNVLQKIPGVPFPVPVIAAENIGLGMPGDELDCIALSESRIPVGSTFVLLFTVDRWTTGEVPPSDQLRDSETPFNVADQVTRGHAAGDAFLSLSLFTHEGIVPDMRDVTGKSNTQALNNYDEGGHDFEADPPTSSRTYLPTRGTIAQDDVDALAFVPMMNGSRTGQPPIPSLYYSVTADSPSLLTLPGNTGADIIFDPEPMLPGAESRFASALDMGLQPTDEIDALVVFDANQNGEFDLGDQVLFSLAPGSGSLHDPTGIPGMSSNGAADVFSVRIGIQGLPELSVFAAASDLGLVGPLDNIDGLEVLPCPDAVGCAANAGIRLVKGDWDNDANVDSADFPPLLACFSGPHERVPFGPPEPICLDVFDCDRDRDVDLVDFARFQDRFGLTGPLPAPSSALIHDKSLPPRDPSRSDASP